MSLGHTPASAGHDEPGLGCRWLYICDTMELLRLLAHRRGASVTETIRRAIVVLKFVEDEVDKGNKLAVVDRDSSGKEQMREILLVG